VKVDIGARAAAITPAMAFAPIAAVAGFFSFDTVQDVQRGSGSSRAFNHRGRGAADTCSQCGNANRSRQK